MVLGNTGSSAKLLRPITNVHVPCGVVCRYSTAMSSNCHGITHALVSAASIVNIADLELSRRTL